MAVRAGRRLLVWLVLLSGVGCAEPPPAVLEVDGLGYTREELGLLTDSQQRDLATLAAFGLAISEGRRQDLTAPFVAQERRSRLLRQLSAEVAVREAGLTEEELRARYRQDPEHELEVRHLVILSERWQSEAEREEARRRAQAALERARSGEDFAALAGAVSEEPGAAERGGLLEPGRSGTWVDEFWQAASALDEGEISDVVETEYGYHVIRLEDRRAIPFEEVRNQVLPRLIDMDRAMAAARSWAAREAAGLAVDTGAVRAFRSDGDSLVLARWDGGRLTSMELRSALATLEPDAQDRVSEATVDELARYILGVARNRLLADRAQGLGLAVPEPELESIREDATRRVAGWAESLGFEADMETPELKDAAMAALGASQQRARLARADVLRLRPLLEGLYTVRMAADSVS